MQSQTLIDLPWREPLQVAAAQGDAAPLVVLLSDGGPDGRWSYLAREPDEVLELAADDSRDGLALMARWLGRAESAPEADAPPFPGGVIGLLAYEYAARLEPLDLVRDAGWPDLILMRFSAVLAFDHHARRVVAVGRGEDVAEADRRAGHAATWLDTDPDDAPLGGAPAAGFEAEASGAAYETAVADVVARIGAGEIFQANIARAWSGRLRDRVDPSTVFLSLARRSPAPFCAYLRLGDRALVSHSPERFVSIAGDGATVRTRPIKGTRPRGRDPERDAALKAELEASAKDRAENLMIVDLMRNDLARVCVPGSVRTPDLFRTESFASVHHLVSTVTGRLREGVGAAGLLRATFPPGSITGAPKVQAMKVIAGHERFRGPWCGALFWAGHDGALESSVLIRTAGFVRDAQGWRFRTQAGAGIVADSVPAQELEETEAKISGLRRALTEAP